ncbi:MAG TPA: tetratricopeptide repeat protein [Stellaceae bacterium]|nr:tetratricopeptide repeat protein [Stellaceae bacterium]
MALDHPTITRMAFSILITFLEREGVEPFANMVDTLYIGFDERGPFVTELSAMQKVKDAVGCMKLSEIPALMKAKQKALDLSSVITPETAEMLLQRELSDAAIEIATRTVDVEARKAFQDLVDHADRGGAELQAEVGDIYRLGPNPPARNIHEAAKWYMRAAAQGHAGAQIALGNLYLEEPEFRHDHREAMKWYRRAADQGLAQAQYNIGQLYLRGGHGVDQDLAEAAKWFQLAAEQGYSDAQVCLGQMYRLGQGVPCDIRGAFQWTLRAARQGSASGQLNLAIMLYAMFEDEQDHSAAFIEAYMWVTLAAPRLEGEDQRNAAEVRELIGNGMVPEQIAEAERRAREWRPEVPTSTSEPRGAGAGAA